MGEFSFVCFAAQILTARSAAVKRVQNGTSWTIVPLALFGRAAGLGVGVGKTTGRGWAATGVGGVAGRIGGAATLVGGAIGTCVSAETGIVFVAGAGGVGFSSGAAGGISGARVGKGLDMAAGAGGLVVSGALNIDHPPSAAKATAPTPTAIKSGFLERCATGKPSLSEEFALSWGAIETGRRMMIVFVNRSGDAARGGTKAWGTGSTASPGPNGVGAGVGVSGSTGGAMSATASNSLTITDASGGTERVGGLGRTPDGARFDRPAVARMPAFVPPPACRTLTSWEATDPAPATGGSSTSQDGLKAAASCS